MTTKPNFAAALGKRSAAPEPTQETPAAPEIAVAVAEKPPADRPPARRGTKHVGGYFDPAVSRQLRGIALEEDSTVQELLGEALDMLFQTRRRPTIARRPAGE